MNSKGSTADNVLIFLMLFVVLYGWINYTAYDLNAQYNPTDDFIDNVSVDWTNQSSYEVSNPTSIMGWLDFNFSNPWLLLINTLLIAPLTAFVGFKIIMGLVPTGSGYK